MKTVEMLLVHGTGGRRDGFTRMLDQAQILFPNDKIGHPIRIEALPWGEIGNKLYANGASIPGYEYTGGGQVKSKPEDVADYDDALWRVIFCTPYYELELERIATRKAASRSTPSFVALRTTHGKGRSMKIAPIHFVLPLRIALDVSHECSQP